MVIKELFFLACEMSPSSAVVSNNYPLRKSVDREAHE